MEQQGKLYLTSDETVLFDTNYRYKISAIEIAHFTKKRNQTYFIDKYG